MLFYFSKDFRGGSKSPTMKNSRNIGRTDRRLRFWLSFLVLIVALWYFNGAAGDPTGLTLSILCGVVMITALAAYCPICHLLRVHTLSEEEIDTYGSPYYPRKRMIEA